MRKRIISSSTPNGSLPEPDSSQCASGLVITGVTRNTVSLLWTAGASGTRVVVLALAGASTLSENPVDFASDYTANATYTLATSLTNQATPAAGTARVVYNGNATAMTVSGLAANTLHAFKVITYNADASNDFFSRNYNTKDTLLKYTRTSR